MDDGTPPRKWSECEVGEKISRVIAGVIVACVIILVVWLVGLGIAVLTGFMYERFFH